MHYSVFIIAFKHIYISIKSIYKAIYLTSSKTKTT